MSTHSNSRLNSLSHGGAAESLFIPGENPADFEDLLHHAFAEHQPSSDQHSAFVYHSVHARWLLARRQRTTAAYELELHKQMPDPTHWPNESLTRLNLFDRYKTQAERALRRAAQQKPPQEPAEDLKQDLGQPPAEDPETIPSDQEWLAAQRRSPQ